MRITQVKDKTLRFLRAWIGETIILLALLVIVKHFIGQPVSSITADGVGYYEYLPSTFIRGDIHRNNKTCIEDTTTCQRLVRMGVGYGDYEGYVVNKYPCGVALLQSPFFFITKATTKKIVTGYEQPFQNAAYYSALFYLFVGLCFLKGLLLLYDVKRGVIFLMQTGVALATNLAFYVVHDSSFSHVYSFFAITAFLFAAKKYFKDGTLKWVIYTCILLGIVLLLRQINILVLFTLPFIAGSFTVFKERMLQILKSVKWLGLSVLIVFGICSIQITFWYLQTGSFFIYSYQGETFDFSQPHVMDVWFSYRRGLFLYTPFIFLSILATVYYLIKKQWYQFVSFISFFVMFTYVISCWWTWVYGCGFGHRVFIDYYGLFVIPLAVVLSNIKWWIGAPLTSGLLYFMIVLNFVQIYQYKYFILHWLDMDKEKYWLIFMETDPRYRTLVWKEKPIRNEVERMKRFELGNLDFSDHEFRSILVANDSSGVSLDQLNYVRIQFTNRFDQSDSSRIVVNLTDTLTNTPVYYDDRSILHFQEKGLNRIQRGEYWLKIPEIPASNGYKLEVRYFATEKSRIKKVNIEFYHRK